MFREKNVLAIAAVLLFLTPLVSLAQTSAPAAVGSRSQDVVRSELLALRDDFINRIKTEGFQPSLAAPAILVDNPPSYGRYEDDKNEVHAAIWTALSPEQQARFSRIAARRGTNQSGEDIFEESIHHWVFVHELSHWWQASQRQSRENHYSVEYGANRIAAAYWRLTNPQIWEDTVQNMMVVAANTPNPVPEGHSNESFFNQNYDQLGPTPAYIWFQSSMIISIQAEKPAPSLKQTLEHSVYP